jgi:cell division septal protein FtsQ
VSRRDTRTPKRRKKSAASRLSRFWIPAVVIVAVAAIVGYLGTTWSGFLPTKIAVSGNGGLPASQILAAAEIDPARNLWLQDKHAMIKRIEAIPLVDTAAVHRGLPATVAIAVTLRRPALTILSPGAGYVVDAALRVLYAASGDPDCPCVYPNRPLALQPGAFVTDAQVVAMRDDLAAMQAAHVDATQLRYDKYESLIVTLRGGPTVLLGDDGEDLQKKIGLIGPIRAQLAKGKPIAAIDLRAPNTPVVKYK